MNYNKAIKLAGVMAIITVAAKFIGLVRQMVLTAAYTTEQLGPFMAAQNIQISLFDLTIGGVITAAMIPVFNTVLVKEDKEKALKFANEYINFILLITTLLTVGVILLAKPLMGFVLTGPQITPQDHILGVKLLRIMIVSVIFTGLAYSFVGILQSNGQFYIASILSLIANGLFIMYILVFGEAATFEGLAIVVVIGWVMQVAIQAPSIWKYGYRYKPTFKFMTPEMKSAFALSGPILITSWAQPLASMINVRMASYINGTSSVTAINLANQLYIVISGVFGYIISNLAYPYLARASVNDDATTLKNTLRTLIKSITFIITPIMVGLIILAIPITQLAYQRGEFMPQDTLVTGTALMAMSFGMLAFSYNEILNKTFYAMNDSKVPMKTSLTGMVATITLCILLPQYMGIAGIGFAIAIGTILTAVLNFGMISRKLKHFFGKEGWIEVGKIGIAAGVMAVVAILLREQFDHVFLKVIIPTVGGAIIYLGLCMMMRVSIMMMLLDFLWAKLKKGGNDGK